MTELLYIREVLCWTNGLKEVKKTQIYVFYPFAIV